MTPPKGVTRTHANAGGNAKTARTPARLPGTLLWAILRIVLREAAATASCWDTGSQSPPRRPALSSC